MSRSTHDLLLTVENLNKMGVGFISKKEGFDTNTPTGKMLLTIIAGINEFEREVMLERQKGSIAAMPVVDGKRVSAKTGRGFGRPKVKYDRTLLEKLIRAHSDGELTVKQCCEQLGISRSVWYREAGKAAV